MLDDDLLQQSFEASLLNILVVDADSASAASTREMLEQKGLKATFARDGGQAHGSIRMTQPDLVLLEAILPGESGFEVCERIKAQFPLVPILFFTEINLDSARNLARRIGADGYLIRPCSVSTLYDVMKQVANSVIQRVEQEKQEEGAIHFQCRCGKRLQEKLQNRGKFMTCRRCSARVQIPNQSTQEFITRVDSDLSDSSTEVNPLQFLTVKCSSCATYFRLASSEGLLRQCPSCGAEQKGAISIEGAPMSRAALESSLRVLRILNGRNKGKKMMLPLQEVVVGRSAECHIRPKAETVSDRHCSLEPGPRGIRVRDLGSQRGTYINETRIDNEALLRPGNVLRIGSLKFRLLGDDLPVEEELQRVQKWSAEEEEARRNGASVIEAGSETAAEAAQVIRQHWNITRRLRIDHAEQPASRVTK